eukprot:5499153-Amphidinium_carterae.1
MSSEGIGSLTLTAPWLTRGWASEFAEQSVEMLCAVVSHGLWTPVASVCALFPPEMSRKMPRG